MAVEPRVLVAGAGLTGSAACHLLGPGLSVALWDKAAGPGGRMATCRAAGGGQADLGAQYVSIGAGGGNSTAIGYDWLAQRGLLAKFDGVVLNARDSHHSASHLVAPAGLEQICRELASPAETQLGRQLTGLDLVNGQWRAESEAGPELFDAVVLAVPTPAALALSGEAAGLIRRAGAERVQYSTRWAVGLFYPPAAWPALSRLSWAGRYVTKQEDDTLVWLGFDSRKRGAPEAGEPGPVLVAHTSVPWGIAHQAEPADWVGAHVAARVEHLLASELGQPPPVPAETIPLLWRESQVRPGTELACEPGALLLEQQGPPLVLAGDGVAGSNFENCLRSAEAAAQIVRTGLGLSAANL